MYGYIYFTKNLINNKKYIGQHKGLFTEKYLGSGLFLKKAIQKYGKEKFEVHLWEYFNSINELNIIEEYYIKKYNAVEDPMYYNLQPGGNVVSPSKETRLKQGKSRLGKKHSDETKKKIGLIHKNKITSEETKKKISLSKQNISKQTKLNISKGCKNQIKSKCPYCDIITTHSNLKRWHFKNCKYKNNL